MDAARWMALRMRWYVPQRQMLPLMKSSISESVGLGFLASSATADMICPDWQYPHCGTSSAIHACWTGWLPSADKPSMVVTFFPATLEMAVWQERAASPLLCTVHAPHKPAPHPNFVPVLSSVSRSTQSSGISGLTSTVWDFPLRVKVVAIGPPSAERYPTTTRGGVKTNTTPSFVMRLETRMTLSFGLTQARTLREQVLIRRVRPCAALPARRRASRPGGR